MCQGFAEIVTLEHADESGTGEGPLSGVTSAYDLRRKSSTRFCCDAQHRSAVVGDGPSVELEGQVRRHGTASRKTVKTRRRKTTKAKLSSGPIRERRGHAYAADLSEQLKRQARELEEAREERAANAEVLRLISSSPGELEPVFQTILQNATRICEAKFATLYLCDADAFRVVAMHNTPPAYAEARQREALV